MDEVQRLKLERWIAICKESGKLHPNQWQGWAFMVGTGGTIDDRIYLAERALKIVTTPGIAVAVPGAKMRKA